MLAELVDYIEVHADKQLTIHFKFADQIEQVRQYLASLNVSAVPPNGTDGGGS